MEVDIQTKILCTIAYNTKQRKETVSESICLNNRDLLWSDCYSRVCIPSYNLFSAKGTIKTIILAHYIINLFPQTQIYLASTRKNPYFRLLELFKTNNIVVVDIKKYAALLSFIQNKGVTKIIYNESLDFFHEVLPVTEVVKNTISISDNYSANGGSKSVVVSLPHAQIKQNKSFIKNFPPQSVHVVHDNALDMERDLEICLRAQNYFNMGTSHDLDVIAPFIGMNIYCKNKLMYDDLIFKNSTSVIMDRIIKLD